MGEYITDDRVWIVKAHHPGLMPMCLPFKSNKVICCIRNPLDVIPSYAAFANTMTHSSKPSFDIHTEYPEWWDFWVKAQTKLMKQYFDTMIGHCYHDENKQNPIYFVRYEDLCDDIVEPTKGLMEFLLDLDDISGTNCERRIHEQAAKGKAATQTYARKATTGIANVHIDKYTKDQLEFIKAEIGHLLYFFGYVNHPEEENKKAYFHFDNHTEENLANYYKFKDFG